MVLKYPLASWDNEAKSRIKGLAANIIPPPITPVTRESLQSLAAYSFASF